MHAPITPDSRIPAALVWLDRSHALVAQAIPTGALVTEVDRELDPEHSYLLRIAREVADCDRLVVMGPEAARIAFEREFVALCRRPDRLVDAGMELEPEPRELADRLRVLGS